MPKEQLDHLIFQDEGKAFIRNVANNSPNVNYRTVHSLKFRSCFSYSTVVKVLMRYFSTSYASCKYPLLSRNTLCDFQVYEGRCAVCDDVVMYSVSNEVEMHCIRSSLNCGAV